MLKLIANTVRDGKSVEQVLYEPRKPISNENSDIVKAEFSYYRGPNKVEWYTFMPQKSFILGVSNATDFEIKITDANNRVRLTCHLRLSSINWDKDKNCFKLTFVPDLFNYMEQIIKFDNIDTESKTIEEFLKSVLPDSIDVMVSNEYKRLSIAKGMRFEGRLIDFISLFCYYNICEFYIKDDYIAIGNVTINDNIPSYRLPNIDIGKNTISEYENMHGKNVTVVHSIVSPLCPGNRVVVQDEIVRRIIHLSMISTQDKDFQCTYFLKKADNFVSEEELFNMFDYETSQILKYKTDLTQKFSSYIGQQSNLKKETDTVKYVNRSPNNKDPSNIDIKKDNFQTYKVRKSSPYAGKNVGLQFPDSQKGDMPFSVVVNDRGDHSSEVEVGQVWQDGEGPKRTSSDDFRLTLPDGGTLYYDDSSGEWILAAKSKVSIGKDSTVNSNSVPSVDSDKKAARVGDEITVDISTDSDFLIMLKLLKQAFTNWVPAPTDGGAMLKTMLSSLSVPNWDDQDAVGKITKGSSDVNIGGSSV